MKNASFCATALLLAFGVVPAYAAGEPYEIHVIESLSGGGAFLGKAQQQSIQVVEKVANAGGGIAGRPVRFVFHDDQSSPQIAVQIATELLPPHPAFMIGSGLVATCNALMPLMQNGPVYYCFSSGAHPPDGSYVYSADSSTRDLATASMRFFRLKGWTKIAIITSTDASGQDGEHNLLDAAALPENKDLKIVENAHFNPTDVSVSAQMERIKAAAPQVLFAWSTGAPVTTVLRGYAQAGLDIPVTTTNGNMTHAQMTQLASFLPKDMYFQASPWFVDGDPRIALDPAVVAKQKVFFSALSQAGLQPDQGFLVGWEPATMAVEALRKLGPDATAADVRNYLQHLKGYGGVPGLYDFERTPQRGLAIENTILARWNAGTNRWEAASQLTGIPLP